MLAAIVVSDRRSKSIPVFTSVLLWLLFACAASISAQETTLRVEVRTDGKPVESASVVVDQRAQQTMRDGVATITLGAGTFVVVVSKEGLMPVTASVTLAGGEMRTLMLDLEPQAALEEHVTVSATRTGGRLEDQPMRVEVLDREEVEEKLMMTPGDIVMMLNEMGGLRVQATSPSLGAASVRVQGMRGRYTRFLSDGLPLFGEQAGSFGLLQIPPMDLGRVEVIKGVASSLYGAGAMGGVVNLISRRPGSTPEREVLVNRSSRGATDGVFWYSAPLAGNWGATLLGSAHGQSRADVDHDGWSDLPYYARGVVRPRVFWDDKAGRSFFATAGLTIEDRSGGSTAESVIPGSRFGYEESLDTRRADVGVMAQTLIAGVYVVSARASFVHETKAHQFGDVPERDRHRTVFAEVTARRAIGRQTVVVGAALEHDAFTPRDTPQFRYAFTVPGVFAQDDIAVSKWLSLSGSARVDVHNEYGTFVSPRLSALLRSNRWSSRASIGTGFYPSTVLTEETESAGLSRLVVQAPLRPERGRSVSVDLTYTTTTWSATATVFHSRIRDPIAVERDTSYVLRNLAEPTTNTGLELLGTSKRGLVSVTATYAYVRARESQDGTARDVALTPRHSAGLVGMWEKEDVGRIGVEWYYTGHQRLEANPYRGMSQPYAVFGALVERKFGAVRVFVNAENLGDVRQTTWDPLVRPTRGADGRWTVDAWAPLDGRNINGGVRVLF
jgi:outer membrane receptor for ferrienterochelin and colicins